MVADQVRRCAGPYPGAGFEPPEIERRQVELAFELGIRGEQYLEAAIQAVTADNVGADPSADSVRCFQYRNVMPRFVEQPRCGKTSESRTYDHDLGTTRQGRSRRGSDDVMD